MGPGPFGAGDLFGGGCKTAGDIIESGKTDFLSFSTTCKWNVQGCGQNGLLSFNQRIERDTKS